MTTCTVLLQEEPQRQHPDLQPCMQRQVSWHVRRVFRSDQQCLDALAAILDRRVCAVPPVVIVAVISDALDCMAAPAALPAQCHASMCERARLNRSLALGCGERARKAFHEAQVSISVESKVRAVVCCCRSTAPSLRLLRTRWDSTELTTALAGCSLLHPLLLIREVGDLRSEESKLSLVEQEILYYR